MEFEKYEIDYRNEVDTIESKGNILICNIINRSFLGNFSIDNVIIFRRGERSFSCYKIKRDRNEVLSMSEKNLAFVKPYSTINFGWYYIKDSIFVNELPNSIFIEDSLQQVYNNCFISVRNGVYRIFKDGRLIHTFGYGNFVLDSNFNYNDLDINLYRLENNQLIEVSKNPDDLFMQKDGVFYVPPPGYGIIRRYKKYKLLIFLDSVSKLKTLPNRFSYREYDIEN